MEEFLMLAYAGIIRIRSRPSKRLGVEDQRIVILYLSRFNRLS